MQRSVILTNTAVECIRKHQYEHYLTHKKVMGDTFALQGLAKVSNELELDQT